MSYAEESVWPSVLGDRGRPTRSTDVPSRASGGAAGDNTGGTQLTARIGTRSLTPVTAGVSVVSRPSAKYCLAAPGAKGQLFPNKLCPGRAKLSNVGSAAGLEERAVSTYKDRKSSSTSSGLRLVSAATVIATRSEE